MEVKMYPGCNETKPLTDFNFKNKRKGLRQVRCRDCTREQVRAHYQAHQYYYVRKAMRRKAGMIQAQREWVLNYFVLHPCVDCGERDPRCLDFDHVRGKKRCDISRMLGNFGWAAIEREVSKCVVRCANCHRKRTAERRQGIFYPFLLERSARSSTG